jgi:acetoin utilization deacetylase AcuC-like enzyme
MLVISSPDFAHHLTPPGHPESPERGEVLEAVAAAAAARGVRVEAPRRATREELRRVHTEAYLRRIEETAGSAVALDADTFTSPDTVDVATLAAGAVVQAVDEVLAGRTRRAAALVRPPGHHAESGRAMGFCFYSNVAIGAAHALARGAARVAVVDYDVHHGNGTQEIFHADPRVLFVSVHQSPFYPGTGGVDEIGAGEGAGTTVNVPLDAGATDGDYLAVFERAVVPIVSEYAPELLLVSAGFDAHEADPLAQMRVTAEGFRRMTGLLRDTADRVCGGRLVLATEGGYALSALAASLDGALQVLEGADAATKPAGALRAPTGRADRALAALRAAQTGRWHAL